jgi:hypothetical protein
LLVIGGTILVVAFLLVGIPSLLTWVSSVNDAPERPEPEVYYPENSESGIWPYLSKKRQPSQHSPINVIVRGDSTQVARLLTDVSTRDWNETGETERDESLVQPDTETYDNRTLLNETISNESGVNEAIVNESVVNGSDLIPTRIHWTPTAGAVRYAYIDPGQADAYSTTETLQVDDGDYFGRRFHIRLYQAPNPDDEWVALQAHTEHFDWFTLRHQVDGARAAQARVETDLISASQVDLQEDVSRIYVANSGGTDHHGWATLVDVRTATLAPLLFVLAIGTRVRRRVAEFLDRSVSSTGRARLAEGRCQVPDRYVGLLITVVSLLIGVRLLGIIFERHIDQFSVYAIAATLYPLISVGIPVVTYAWARGIRYRLGSAITASFALSAAMWMDYVLVGVETVSFDLLLQRMLMVVALGLLAAGAARRASRDQRLNDLLVGGVTIWTLTLTATLLGYL